MIVICAIPSACRALFVSAGTLAPSGLDVFGGKAWALPTAVNLRAIGAADLRVAGAVGLRVVDTSDLRVVGALNPGAIGARWGSRRESASWRVGASQSVTEMAGAE